MDLITLMAVAESVAIPHIISKQVLPALKRLADTVKKDFKLKVEPLGTHFEQYLKRAYEKNSYLNTLVFPNQQKLLDDLYVPLTLVEENGGRVREDMVLINEYPNSFISKYRRVLIKDSAGMGKSTLSKKLFLSVIDKEVGIPFFVELRRLSKTHLLLDEIREQLGSLTKEFDDNLMRAFFQEGGFVFFFDGFDEISGDDRSVVIDDLKRFVEKAPDNYYIMTSRPELALTGFGDFKSMAIRPLEKEEAYCLLRKYDSRGDTSRRLIEKLEAGDYQRIEDFLQNPLLVSLLFVGFEYVPDIPLKIHQFYDQVFVALFNRHDLSKDASFIRKKKSGLERNDFEKVLRSIGFICLKKHRLEFSRSDFLEIITQAEKLSCVSLTSAEKMMDDLLHAVPLFCQDGVNYKWVHKSLQEYFAADFINRDSADKKQLILERIAKSPDFSFYQNVIKLFSDLDNKNYQLFFVLPVLIDYISFVEKPIVLNQRGNETRIRYRRQLLSHFDNELYLYVFTGKESAKNHNFFEYVRRLINKPIYAGFIYGPSRKPVYCLYGGRKRVDSDLFGMVISSFPENERSSSELMKNGIRHIEQGTLLQVTESLMIDNSEAYDELNNLLRIALWRFMSLEDAIVLKNSIEQQCRENEDVFKGLLDL